MTEERMERKLGIWKKVEECEKSLQRITELDARVNRLIALERLLSKKEKLKNP